MEDSGRGWYEITGPYKEGILSEQKPWLTASRFLCCPQVGGFDGANRLRSAEAYSPVANTWRTIPTMFNPRSNFGIEVVDDLLFVVGGFNGFTTTFNVECYDEKTDEWYDAHDMSIYRSALSCCVVPGLANVGEYAARRDNFTGLALRDEVKYSASTSTLPV